MAYRESCTYVVLVRLLVWVMIDGVDVTTSAGTVSSICHTSILYVFF